MLIAANVVIQSLTNHVIIACNHDSDLYWTKNIHLYKLQMEVFDTEITQGDVKTDLWFPIPWSIYHVTIVFIHYMEKMQNRTFYAMDTAESSGSCRTNHCNVGKIT